MKEYLNFKKWFFGFQNFGLMMLVTAFMTLILLSKNQFVGQEIWYPILIIFMETILFAVVLF